MDGAWLAVFRRESAAGHSVEGLQFESDGTVIDSAPFEVVPATTRVDEPQLATLDGRTALAAYSIYVEGVPYESFRVRTRTIDPDPRPNGAACSEGSECESGFCVDDVCCESDCDDGDDCTADSCTAVGECAHAPVVGRPADAGTPDAGAPDAGAPDAGPRDAGPADAGASHADNGGCGCRVAQPFGPTWDWMHFVVAFGLLLWRRRPSSP